MNFLTKKFKQFMCLHYWAKTGVLEAYWPKGVKYEYTCDLCNKHVGRWNYDIPISGIITVQKPHNPDTDIMPPMIVRNDNVI